MDHYRCMRCFNPDTGREIDVDTLQFFPHNTPLPEIATEDYLKQAATDIVSILQSPPTSTPSLNLNQTTSRALIYIANILNRAAPVPKVPSIESISPFKSPNMSLEPSPVHQNQSQPVSPAKDNSRQSTPAVPLPRVVQTQKKSQSPSLSLPRVVQNVSVPASITSEGGAKSTNIPVPASITSEGAQ